MVLPQPFSTASPVIATFSYEDIASGLGVIEFLGCMHQEEAVAGYFLTTSALNSHDITTNHSSTSTALSKRIDIDFDVVLVEQRTIKSHVFVNIPMTFSGNADSKTFYIIAKLRKWDGSSETEIAQAQTESMVNTAQTTENKMALVKIPITSDVILQAGDTLRLTLEGWGVETNGINIITIGHDPQGRDEFDSLTPTILKMQVPFEPIE